MLEVLESSDDRIEVIRSLTFFCEADYLLQSGANHFLEQIADLRGIELLMDLQVNGQDALRIVADNDEDAAPGSDNGEFEV
jgi:hypothetical protein